MKYHDSEIAVLKILALRKLKESDIPDQILKPGEKIRLLYEVRYDYENNKKEDVVITKKIMKELLKKGKIRWIL